MIIAKMFVKWDKEAIVKLFTSDDKVSAGVDVVLGVFGDVLLGDDSQDNLGVKVLWQTGSS